MRTIKKLFGKDNIVGVSFGHTPKHKDRQAGWCYIQCFNLVFCTEWLNKFTYILGRHVEFIPHLNCHLLSPSPNPRGDCTKNSSNAWLHTHQPTNHPRRASTVQCKLGRRSLMENLSWWCLQSTSQHKQIRGGGNRHTQSSNYKHCYSYGSNGYGVPTRKPTPTSYSTIFGCHPPKPSIPQPRNRPHVNVEWRNPTSTPSPSGLPQPTTNQQ